MLSYLKKIWLRFIISYAFLPIIIFTGFGAYSIWKQDLFFYMLASFAISALLIAIPLFFYKRKDKYKQGRLGEMPNIEISNEWTESEKETWDKACLKIDAFVDTPFDWDKTKEDIVTLVDFIATERTGDKQRGYLSFTAPELLIMIEEVSRRYRSYLEKNVPIINNVKISRLKLAYDYKDKVQMAWNIYRIFRLTTPAGIASEIRGILSQGIADDVTDSAITSLRRVLLQEITSVAIDLYAGRFVLLSKQLSQAALEDIASIEEDKENNEPIRITIIGQTSSGKSSFKNAFFGEFKSEIGALPTTAKDQASQINLNDDNYHVIDTVGFNHEKERIKDILKKIPDTDVVIWCLKSTQPSRNPDTELAKSINDYYLKNSERPKPTFIFAITQSDLLDESDYKEVIEYNKEIMSSALSLKEYTFVSVSKHGLGISDIYGLIKDKTPLILGTRMSRKRLSHKNSEGLLNIIGKDIVRTKNMTNEIKNRITTDKNKQ